MSLFSKSVLACLALSSHSQHILPLSQVLVSPSNCVCVSVCEQDSELNELRATIEALKKQSGINVDAFSPSAMRRQSSNASSVGKDLGTPGGYSSPSTGT